VQVPVQVPIYVFLRFFPFLRRVFNNDMMQIMEKIKMALWKRRVVDAKSQHLLSMERYCKALFDISTPPWPRY
jgi:hypothetical protein